MIDLLFKGVVLSAAIGALLIVWSLVTWLVLGVFKILKRALK